MAVETLLEVLSIVGTSMVKFFLSPLVSYSLGYGMAETILLTSIGGCLGVVVFYRSSGWVMERARLRKVRRETNGKPRGRSVTRTNRMIVRVKRSRGLGGLAALTPVLISIPIGSIIAAKYFGDDRRTLPALLVSVLVWAVLLSGFWTFAQ